MVDETRTKKRKSAQRPKLRYFFVNGEIHKKISINRGKDSISTWNYIQRKKIVYGYSDLLKKYETAFTTVEVATMLNRERQVLVRAIKDGNIEEPQFTYSLETGKKFKWLWREADIMELHEFLTTVHRGRPRKDGEINPQAMPTARELRAIIRNEGLLYVKEGEAFVPAWKARNI